MKKLILILTLVGILFGYNAEALTQFHEFNYSESSANAGSSGNLNITQCTSTTVTFVIGSTITNNNASTTGNISSVTIHLPVGIIFSSCSTAGVIVNSSNPQQPIFNFGTSNQTVSLSIDIQACIWLTNATGNTTIDVKDDMGVNFTAIANNSSQILNYIVPIVTALPLIVTPFTNGGSLSYMMAAGDMGELVFQFTSTASLQDITIDLSDLEYITLASNGGSPYSYWIDDIPSTIGYCSGNGTPVVVPSLYTTTQVSSKVITLSLAILSGGSKTVHLCFRAICHPNISHDENINFRTCEGYNESILSNVSVVENTPSSMSVSRVRTNSTIANNVGGVDGSETFVITNHSFNGCDNPSTTTYAFKYTNTTNPVNSTTNERGSAQLTDIKVYFQLTDDLGSISSLKLNGVELYNTTGGDLFNIMRRCTSPTQNDFTPPVFSGSNAIIYSASNRISTYLIDFALLSTASFPGNSHPFGTIYPGQTGGTLMDVDGDGFIDDLLGQNVVGSSGTATGGAFVITVDFAYNNDNAGCVFKNTLGIADPYSTTDPVGHLYYLQTSVKYNNQCNDFDLGDHHNFRTYPRPFGPDAQFRYSSGDQNLSHLNIPPDVNFGDVFMATICPNEVQEWQNEDFKFNCPSGYHNIHMELPLGYSLSYTNPIIPLSANTGKIPITLLGQLFCNNSPITGQYYAFIQEHPEVLPTDNSPCTPGWIDINLNYDASSTNPYGLLPLLTCSNANKMPGIDCISIPLVYNCNNCQGQNSGSTNAFTDPFTYSMEYICCTNPTANEFPPPAGHCGEQVARAAASTVHHTCGTCSATHFETFANETHNSFTFERRTFGWACPNTTIDPYGYDSNTLTTATQLNASSPGINLKAAYSNDKVEAQIEGEFSGGNPSDYSRIFLRLRYNTILGCVNPVIFMQDPNIQSSIVATDDATGTSFTTTNVTYASFGYTGAPVSGKRYLEFNIDPTSFINGHSYHLVADIHLIVKSTHPASSTTFFTTGEHHLDDFRGEFMGILLSGQEELSCDNWGAEFTILQPTNTFYKKQQVFSPLTSTNNSCSVFDYSIIFSVWKGTLEPSHADFPNEFRPYAKLDDFVSIVIPPGYTLQGVKFGMHVDNYTSNGGINNFANQNQTMISQQMNVSDYTYDQNTNTVSFHGLHNGSSTWPLLDCKLINIYSTVAEVGYPLYAIILQLQPDCDAPALDQLNVNAKLIQNYQNQDAMNIVNENEIIVPNAASPNGFMVSHVSPNVNFHPPSSGFTQSGTLLTSPVYSYCFSGDQYVTNGFLYLPNTTFNAYFQNLVLTLNAAACSVSGAELPPIQIIPYDSNVAGFNLPGFSLSGYTPSLNNLEDRCICFNLTGNITNVPDCALPQNSNGSYTFDLPIEYIYSCTGAAPYCPTYNQPNIIHCTFFLDSTYVPAPTITATASVTNVCPSTSVTLSASSNVSGTTNYSWSDGINTISTAQTFTVSPTATTTYIVTGVDAVSLCSNTATVTVTVNPTVVVNSPTICSGRTALLTASIINSTGNATYTWSAGATSTGVNTASATPTITTTYTVTGNNGTCSNTAISTVTVVALPSITVNSATICLGQTAQLTANGGTSYTWSAGAISTGVNTAETLPATATSSTYTVTGTNSGCSNTALSTVTVTPVIWSVSVNDPIICEGDVANIEVVANNLTSVTWGAGLTSTSGTTATAMPTTTTNYTVSGIIGTSPGCPVSTAFTVTVVPYPIISVNSPTICVGETANLIATGAIYYTWPNGITPYGQSSTANASPSSTTTYTVTGGEYGCTSTTTTTVTVNPLPILSVTASTTSVCAGASVTLTGGGAVTYVWNNGVQNGVPFVPTTTDEYTLTGTDGNGCSNTAGVVVSVNSLPDIQPITNINICDATNATWYTIPNYNSNYTYIISALSGTYYLNGISPVDNQGNFSINWNSQAVIYGSTLTITVIDGNTCSNSITIDMLACCDDGITPMFSNKNATDLINYYGIAGSLPTLSSETFIISGVFTVDQDLMLWDCNVLLNKDAIIIVSPNVTFTIDKSHLHACSNNMWRTIRVVGPHAHVETFAAVIEDADVAITSVSGGQYVLDETLFNKNHIGLSVSNYGGNMSNCVVVASFFTSRDFSGLDLINSSAIQSAYATPSVVYPPANLLSGQRAYVGIEVNSMSTLSSNLSLGISNNPNYLVPISVNTFDYLQCGIHLTNSHARIVNNYFENIDYLHFPLQNYQVEGTAIYATSQPTLNSILTIGGANTLEPNFFNECRQGIYTNNCSAEIANNYFSNIYNDGAYVKNCKSRTLNIHDNYFDYAMSAIECNEINIATGISIKSNYVNMNTINSVVWSNGIVPVLGGGPLHSSYGIRVMNLNTVAIPSNLTINHNTIYNSITGIEVWRSVDFEVGPNNDINFLAGVAGSYEYGIKIKDCPSRAKVHDNTITRNSSVNPPDETSPVGIEVYNCSNARINSNTMTKMATGILTQGNNCLNTFFQCNDLIDNYNGFRFGSSGFPAHISDQIDYSGNGSSTQSTGNDWHGGTQGPAGWVTGSVLNSMQNKWYYLAAGSATAIQVNSTPFILHFAPTLNPSTCTSGNRSPSQIREALLGKIIRGENNYTQNSAEYLILDSTFAFNTLAKNDSLLNLGTMDDSLYQNYYNFVKGTNIGAFTKVDKFVLDSIQADTIQAKIVNDNIVTKNSMEDNQKIVNTIYLNQLTYEGDSLCTSNEDYIYTEDEVQQLLNVAYQHPALGGDAVFQARIMLKMDIIDGNHSQRTMQLIPPKDSIANGNFKLFPNPNRGSMTLEYSLNSSDIGLLLIYDIAGKQLKSFKLPSENKMLNIDAAELSAGIYYYIIKVNDLKVKTDKLVIIK